MNRVWIKLYLEILDDPKMGQLPDHLWRRTVELFLLAGKCGDNGTLPPVSEIAWTLRASADEVADCLGQLQDYGIVHQEGEGWVVSHFEKRQYSESYERVKRYRERYSNGKSNAESSGEETSSSSSLSSSSSDSLSSSDSRERGGAGEKTQIPETPKQAAEHPDIQLYEQITGRFPGQSEYRIIIETFAALRLRQSLKLEKYLPPYWAAWSTRKTRDKRPYSRSSPVWYAEWAMQGEIPKANGHEPRLSENSDEKLRKKFVEGKYSEFVEH